MHKKHKEQYLFTLVNARRKKATSFSWDGCFASIPVPGVDEQRLFALQPMSKRVVLLLPVLLLGFLPSLCTQPTHSVFEFLVSKFSIPKFLTSKI